MKITYRITLIGSALDATCNPPSIVSAIFPNFDGWPVMLSTEECIVTAPSPQTPADLGPLVRVEQI